MSNDQKKKTLAKLQAKIREETEKARKAYSGRLLFEHADEVEVAKVLALKYPNLHVVVHYVVACGENVVPMLGGFELAEYTPNGIGLDGRIAYAREWIADVIQTRPKAKDLWAECEALDVAAKAV